MAAAVLLIDDNAVQVTARQAILQRAGHLAIAVLDPEQALEKLQINGLETPVGLVITDHFMPGMNGSMFVQRLREIHPELPVMVISGLEEAESEYEGLNVVFRVKPLLPDELLAQVNRLLAS